MNHRRQAALRTALALLVAVAASGTPAGAGPTLWVRAAGEVPAATRLHLQPGFAIVLRADHRVDTVAIGDPRLVTATVVRRGQDAFDLVLQPQTDAGTTNMIVWYGELATVWTLEIGPGPRTADLVYVVTAGVAGPSRSQTGPSPAAASSGPPAGRDMPPPPREGPVRHEVPGPGQETSPAPAPARDGQPAPAAGQGAGPASAPPGPSPRAAAPSHLEVRQSLGPVTGVFEAVRVADGVMIRYRITNGGGSDLVMRPGSVLVKVNGRVVAYGMARDSIDRGRPDVLPRGATETGVIDAPGATARRVQLIFSLFPAGGPDEPASGTEAPLTFQPAFNEVDRLAITPVP